MKDGHIRLEIKITENLETNMKETDNMKIEKKEMKGGTNEMREASEETKKEISMISK